MTEFAIFVTDFADAGLVVPLCIAVALALLLLRRARIALIWTAVTIAVWGTMLLLKLAGYTVEYVAPSLQAQLGLVTASGHAAGAASTYGALAGLLAGSSGTAVWRSVLTACAVAVLIGATRLLLGNHTLAESVVGGVVGIAGAAAFAGLAGEALHGRRRAAVLAAAAATLVMLHGEHFTLEREISAASARAVRFVTP